MAMTPKFAEKQCVKGWHCEHEKTNEKLERVAQCCWCKHTRVIEPRFSLPSNDPEEVFLGDHGPHLGK